MYIILRPEFNHSDRKNSLASHGKQYGYWLILPQFPR